MSNDDCGISTHHLGCLCQRDADRELFGRAAEALRAAQKEAHCSHWVHTVGTVKVRERHCAVALCAEVNEVLSAIEARLKETP